MPLCALQYIKSENSSVIRVGQIEEFMCPQCHQYSTLNITFGKIQLEYQSHLIRAAHYRFKIYSILFKYLFWLKL